MEEHYLKDLTIDLLMQTSAGETLGKALETFERVQEEAAALAECRGEEALTGIKSGTILTFAVIRKMMKGKDPRNFTTEDWAEIAGDVSRYAVKMDNRKYTEFVFLLYAGYIDFSVRVNEASLTEDEAKAIEALAEELRRKTDLLQDGHITEVRYVDDCLWISLEAILKLLSATLSCAVGEEAHELIQAVTAYAFEYGRLCLYQKQQAILEQYIQNQYQLDAELQAEFNAFCKELQEKEDQFRGFIEHAFEPNFRNDLTSSVELAIAAGVKQEEILDSIEKIDDFFLG